MEAHRTSLPDFKPPPGLQICQLGSNKNWPKLRAMLEEFKSFSVIDSTSEAHLRGIASEIHESRDNFGRTILHWLPVHGDNNSVVMLKDLLALGVNPDPVSNSERTPAHLCSISSSIYRVELAEAIGMCRPDLSLKNIHGNTPADEAKRQGLWDFVIKGGFPTIAQLAHDKKWWAVKNLTRRRVVPEAEKFEKYSGKDTIEWAEYHGEERIAQELRYLLIDEKLPASQDETDVDIEMLKTTLCVAKLDELGTFNSTEAARRYELQDLETKLLSKIDAKFEKFQQEVRELEQALMMREEIDEAQMKAIRDEVRTELSTAAAGCKSEAVSTPSSASTVAPEDSKTKMPRTAGSSTISCENEDAGSHQVNLGSILLNDLISFIDNYLP